MPAVRMLCRNGHGFKDNDSIWKRRVSINNHTPTIVGRRRTSNAHCRRCLQQPAVGLTLKMRNTVPKMLLMTPDISKGDQLNSRRDFSPTIVMPVCTFVVLLRATAFMQRYENLLMHLRVNLFGQTSGHCEMMFVSIWRIFALKFVLHDEALITKYAIVNVKNMNIPRLRELDQSITNLNFITGDWDCQFF